MGAPLLLPRPPRASREAIEEFERQPDLSLMEKVMTALGGLSGPWAPLVLREMAIGSARETDPEYQRQLQEFGPVMSGTVSPRIKAARAPALENAKSRLAGKPTNPLHQAINERDVLYHATRPEKVADILKSGGLEPRAGGLSLSRQPKPGAFAPFPITFELDRAAARTRPFVDRTVAAGVGKTGPGRGGMNPLFEFEQRAERPIPLSAVKRALVDPLESVDPLHQATVALAKVQLKKAGIPVEPMTKHPRLKASKKSMTADEKRAAALSLIQAFKAGMI